MRSDKDVTRKPKIMILICALTISCLFAVSGHTVIMYFVDDGSDPSAKAGFSIGEPVKTHEPVEKSFPVISVFSLGLGAYFLLRVYYMWRSIPKTSNWRSEH